MALRLTKAFGTQIRVNKNVTSSLGRQNLNVQARGPVVTKKGVAFSKKAAVPEPEPEDEEIGALGYGLIAAGAVSNPIVLWSAYTLATTGSGLPEGPSGLLGAAEGVSYLVILGIIAYSLYTKVSTGKGLPPGPGGALGAVEGVTYLSLLAAIAAFVVKP